MASILVSLEEGVLSVTLNRPERKNPLTLESYGELRDAFRDLVYVDGVKSVVITGAGGHFCSGGDLRQLAKRRELSVAERRVRLEGLHDLIRAVRDCPKPVIAAVEGAAAGAGLSLAMACDMQATASKLGDK